MLYLDIRDIFTDNMDEMLTGPAKALLPVFRAIERFAFRSADRINVVSAGFVPHVRSLAPGVEPSVYTNGIDDIFLNEDFANRKPRDRLPLVLYAGNIGEGQGLHRIVPEAARRLAGRARLRIVGDGGRRAALEKAVADLGLDNVEIIPPVPRVKLLDHYREADILFLHLNDLQSFRKVLPSKIFEYAAIGKPMIAGVAGYAADFLAAELPETAVFPPLDVDAMVRAVTNVDMGKSYRNVSFEKKYSRRNVMVELSRSILDMKTRPAP